MANYVQVQYDIASPHGIVQRCLGMKCAVSANNSPNKIPGIASQSCFSAVTIYNNDQIELIYGNSRNKVPFSQNGVACVHGECNAIWEAIHIADGIPTVLEMYIEMEPCPPCRAFLDNVFPGATPTIYYSFNYPAGVNAWSLAARTLVGN